MLEFGEKRSIWPGRRLRCIFTRRRTPAPAPTLSSRTKRRERGYAGLFTLVHLFCSQITSSYIISLSSPHHLKRQKRQRAPQSVQASSPTARSKVFQTASSRSKSRSLGRQRAPRGQRGILGCSSRYADFFHRGQRAVFNFGGCKGEETDLEGRAEAFVSESRPDEEFEDAGRVCHPAGEVGSEKAGRAGGKRSARERTRSQKEKKKLTQGAWRPCLRLRRNSHRKERCRSPSRTRPSSRPSRRGPGLELSCAAPTVSVPLPPSSDKVERSARSDIALIISFCTRFHTSPCFSPTTRTARTACALNGSGVCLTHASTRFWSSAFERVDSAVMA